MSNGWTDYHTLIPVLEKHRNAFGDTLEAVTTSAMMERNCVISGRKTKSWTGYTQTVEVYGCADCSGCEHKSRCLYKYNAEKNPDRNKVMKINELWEELKEESNANIQSEEGIQKRQTRSIQTEGNFGDIKGNENFQRFNYRSEEKVYKEFMLYAIGRNIMRYHRFLHREIEKYEGKKELKTA